ncbi:hypothetical protein AB4143_16885 [Vibrio breoganii]
MKHTLKFSTLVVLLCASSLANAKVHRRWSTSWSGDTEAIAKAFPNDRYLDYEIEIALSSQSSALIDEIYDVRAEAACKELHPLVPKFWIERYDTEELEKCAGIKFGYVSNADLISEIWKYKEKERMKWYLEGNLQQ